MRPEYLVPIQLENYPSNIRVRTDEAQSLSLIMGIILAALGVFILIIGSLIPGLVFIGLGAIGILYTLSGVIKYSTSVRQNKDNFFLFIRDKVSAETGVEISNSQLAKMWVNGKTKIGGYEAYAQGRQGKFFSVGIY
ncbi:MAG: hypothetical protein H9W81_05740 [Enterococcus sp.]|nr:hypothetical protein [Enterococcus sp.]